MAEDEGQEFRLVLDSNCEPIYHVDGSVLIERMCDGYQFYVDPDAISSVDPGAVSSNRPHSPLGIESDNNKEKHWTRQEILQLINEYKRNKENFASSAIKNTKVWQNIAKVIKTHDGKQCENKFKYLKAKYLKKIDNMSNKSSGAGAISFEYFDELNEIFCKQPIVTPVIASTSRDCMNCDIEMNTEINTGENTTTESAPQNISNSNDPPSKNIRLKTAINKLNKILETAEERKERRHQEIIRVHQESLNTFKNLMEKIIEKL